MEFIFKMTNSGVFLNSERMIPYAKTNLPKATFSLSERQPIYWRVKLSGVDGPFYVEVLDYSNSDSAQFDSQQIDLNVERLIFEELDWNRLEPLLSSYQKKAFSSMARNIAPKFKGNVEPGFGTSLGKQANAHQYLFPVIHEPRKVSEGTTISYVPAQPRTPLSQIINIQFSVPFSDVLFHNGFVNFQYKVKEVNTTVDFRIENEYLLKEYDTVKKWFARKLGVKSIHVQATLNLEDGVVISATASSPEIQAINPDLIEKTKEYRTLELIRTTPLSADQALYTSDDVFSALSPDEKGNVFAQTDSELLSILMQKVAIRSREQLDLLSIYQSEDTKLRFTLKPSFGFVFSISCEGFNHFIWELLETHATYVWSVPEYSGEVDQHYEQIEQIISGINKGGRHRYRRQYRNGEADGNATFHFIEHNEGGGFEYWKGQLEQILGMDLGN